MLNLFIQNLQDTTWLEFIAVVFGLLSVWFARKENILVYPTGIINVLIYVYIYFQDGLYGNMGINAFYFLMSVYGWYRWTHKDAQQHSLPISRLSGKGWLVNISATVFFYLVLRSLLVHFTDSTVPDYDAFTTALFIIAMWLMAVKKAENWIFWIIGDALVIPLFAYKGLAFTVIQYLIFLVLAVSGWIEWNRRLRKSIKA